MSSTRTPLHSATARFPIVGSLAKVLLLTSAMLHPGFALADDPGLEKSASATGPQVMLRERQEGRVESAFGIDGRARDLSVVRSAPSRAFDREAVRKMQQSTHAPAEARARQASCFEV